MLYQLQRLYSNECDELSMNDEQVRIWKEIVTILTFAWRDRKYFKSGDCYLPNG